jgi:hypothetical protein
MNFRTSRLSLLLLTFLASLPLHAAQAPTGSKRVKIESLEGAKTVLLQQGLELREAAVGEAVRIGERIRTDEKTTIVLIYPDGSHLSVLPGTDFEVEEEKKGVQSNQLRSGTVRGAVNKEVTAAAAAPKKAIHFVIRTKTAVMGVRGTEFFAAADASSGVAQFHTLEGTVEVASDPGALLGGQGVPVSGGQFVTATESGISDALPFNRTDFLKSVSNSAASSALNSAASSAAAIGRKSDSPEQIAPSAPAAPPPRIPPDPAKPVVPPEVAAEQKKIEDEREKPTYHLLSLALGVMGAEDPVVPAFYDNGNGFGNGQPYSPPSRQFYRALTIAWTPSIPIPVFTFLQVRGNFGAALFQNGSLNNHFLIHEYQVFLVCTLLRPLYVEAGGGEQLWNVPQYDGGIMSANAGFILSENGRLNRIFVGLSDFKGGNHATEYRAGIGLQY